MPSKIGMLDDKDAIGFCTYHARHHFAKTSCPHLQEGVWAMNILQQAWMRLDSTVEILTTTTDAEKKTELGAQARGMAAILSVITPGFSTVEAVSKEAGRRLGHKNAGRAYQTPGIRGRVEL